MPPKTFAHGPEAESGEQPQDTKARDGRQDSQFPRTSDAGQADTASATSNERTENTPHRPSAPQPSQEPVPTLPDTTFQGFSPRSPSEATTATSRSPASRGSRPIIDVRPLRERLQRRLSAETPISPGTVPSGQDPAGTTERQRQKSAVSVSRPENAPKEQQHIVPLASSYYPGGRETPRPAEESNSAQDQTGLTERQRQKSAVSISSPGNPSERQQHPATIESSRRPHETDSNDPAEGVETHDWAFAPAPTLEIIPLPQTEQEQPLPLHPKLRVSFPTEGTPIQTYTPPDLGPNARARTIAHQASLVEDESEEGSEEDSEEELESDSEGSGSVP